MATSTSYRLDPALKARLAAQATTEGVAETALVTRLLEQGLSTIRHPGVVFRPGPSGWRAALAGGPDVDEVVRALRSGGATGDDAVAATAADLGIDARLVRIAVDYAAEHLEEIEARLRDNDEAAERVRRLTEGRAAVLAE
jgi:CubicO group peptidase (beta-lactamase class C family)